MLLGHPLTLKSHQHNEHPHPKLFAKRMKRKNWIKKDTEATWQQKPCCPIALYSINMAIETN